MKSFGDLLNEHIQRVGISDTELARAIGVSRQTIFRWREGATARPRHRGDVLAIADKLRLTPEERDALLLAAGFRPVATAKPVTALPAESETTRVSHASAEPAGAPVKGQRHPRRLAAIAAGALLLGIAVLLIWHPWQTTPPLATPAGGTTATPPVSAAIPGESLVLVAATAVDGPFSAALVEALRREVLANRLEDIQVTAWPAAVTSTDDARKAGRESGAALVIHVSLQSDQIVVHLLHPAGPRGKTAPFPRLVDQPLTAHAAGGSQGATRWLALLALGQLVAGRDQWDTGLALTAQAYLALSDRPAVEQSNQVLAASVLCWGYALDQQSQQALPYCQYAVTFSSEPVLLAGRGLAQALAGDHAAAAADWGEYIAWLEQQTGQEWSAHLARCQGWQEALQAGENPFTSVVLADLQDEFGQ